MVPHRTGEHYFHLIVFGLQIIQAVPHDIVAGQLSANLLRGLPQLPRRFLPAAVQQQSATLKELSAEYDALKSEKEADDAALAGLKPKLTTLNHIKYNFDILERDYLPEEKDLRREEIPER